MSWRRVHPVVPFVALVVAVGITLLLALKVWRSGEGDVLEYQNYAQAFWWWKPVLETLPREYPPFALLPFSLTLLAGNGDPQLIFGVCMGGLFLVGYLGFARFSSRSSGYWYAGYLLVGAQGLVLSRYDLVPALLTLGALWATQHRRFSLAYGLLVLGTLLKLYPVVLVPVVLIEQAWALYLDMPPLAGSAGAAERTVAQRLRRVVWPLAYTLLPWMALLVAGVALPLVGKQGSASALIYLTMRPIQVESFPATVLWLRTLVGVPMHVSNSFGSDNWDGADGLAGLLGALSPYALVVGCLVVYLRLAWRRIAAGHAFLACVCIVLVTSKVFSTQYLIWALPLVAAVEGGSFAWAVICLLTFVDYPLIYPFNQPDYTVPWAQGFMLVLAARNLLLLYVTVRVVAGVRAGMAKRWRLWPSRALATTGQTSG